MAVTINASTTAGLVNSADTSGILQLQTANTTALTIDASQNVGLGVTPSAWGGSYKALQFASGAIAGFSTTSLDIYGNAYDSGAGAWKYLNSSQGATRYAAFNGQHIWLNAPSGTAGNAITFTQAMTLDASGRLGLGTTSPATNLEIRSLTNPTIRLSNSETAAQPNDVIGTLEYYSFDGDGAHVGAYVKAIQDPVDIYGRATALTFGTNAINVAVAERMRITADGNLLVGTTSNLAVTPRVAIVASNFGLAINTTNGGANEAVRFYNASTAVGTITTTGSATAYNTSSDQRLKQNIQNADSASTLIDSLQVRQFDWKADGSHQRYGFIAQELVTVAPEAVHQPEDSEEMMAVDYSKLVPMLVKEIQSLRKRLADAGIA